MAKEKKMEGAEVENVTEEVPTVQVTYSAKEAIRLLELGKFQVIRLEHYIAVNKFAGKELSLNEWRKIVRGL